MFSSSTLKSPTKVPVIQLPLDERQIKLRGITQGNGVFVYNTMP